MPIQVDDELEDFQAFLAEVIDAGRRDLRPEDVLAAWRERQETVASIRRGLADVEAGRTTPLVEYVRSFDARHGLDGAE